MNPMQQCCLDVTRRHFLHDCSVGLGKIAPQDCSPIHCAQKWPQIRSRYAGRGFRLTDVHGKVVKAILA